MKKENKKKYIVIIPARGGSKSIKNKNLLKIIGDELIKIAIKKFKKLDHFLDIIVSSDSKKILKVAEREGAFCIERSKKISGDFASSESAILEAINIYSKFNNNFNSIIFHQCTSPFISYKSITNIISEFEKSPNNTFFSVIKEDNPIWTYNKIKNSYEILNNFEKIRGPRQNRDPHYIETGGIYVFCRKKFKQTENRFIGRSTPILIPKFEGIDIDDKDDLNLINKLKTKYI